MNKYLTSIFLFCITILPHNLSYGGNNVVTSKNNLYKITIPDEQWELKKISDDVTLLQHKNEYATVACITNPVKMKGLPLKVLVNHLLIQIENKTVLQRSDCTIDGLKAVNVLLKGNVDGHIVKMNLFVTKKDAIAYNIIYWAHPNNYDKTEEEFASLVKNFKFIK